MWDLGGRVLGLVDVKEGLERGGHSQGEDTAEAKVCRPHSLEWTQDMTAIHVAGEDSKEVDEQVLVEVPKCQRGSRDFLL